MDEHTQNKIRLEWMQTIPALTVEHYGGRWHIFAQGRSFAAGTFWSALDFAYEELVLIPARAESLKEDAP